MRFKSIQFSVVVLAGASVLAVVVALVLYALFAGSRTQDLVHERTQSLLEQVIDQRLIALAEAQVGKLQRQFEAPMTLSKSLATLNSQMALGADGAAKVSLSRDELSALISVYLAEASNVVPQGFPVTVMRTGDYWATATVAAAVKGNKVFAKLSDGTVQAGAAGATIAGFIETDFGNTPTGVGKTV